MQAKKNKNIFQESNLTHSQFLIWTGQKLNPDKPLYNMAMAFALKGDIDTGAMRKAITKLIGACDVLRMVITEQDGIPQQTFRQVMPNPFEPLDFSDEADPEVTLDEWLQQRSTLQFSLEDCLFDIAIIRIAEQHHVLFINQHHLATDGWSIALLYDYVIRFYLLALSDQLSESPAIPSYEAYTVFEKESREKDAFLKARSHWQSILEHPVEPFNFYGKTIETDSTVNKRVFCDLGKERTAKLKAIAMEKDIRSFSEHLSLYNLFSGLLFAFLFRMSGNKELAIGAPAHNRPTKTFKQTVGLFIELFPMRVSISPQETFSTLIRKVTRETMNFLKYAQPGSGSAELGNSYNVVLNFIHATFPEFPGNTMNSRWIHPGHVDRGHGLRLQIHDFDNSGSIQLHFDFNCDIFDENLQQLVVEHFYRLVDEFIDNRDQEIAAIDLLGQQTRQSLLVNFNNTAIPASKFPTALAMIGNQLTRYPANIAIRSEETALSYAELDLRASRLAAKLRRRAIQPNPVIGIYAERSIELIIAVLGILKSGGAFVSIEPGLPKERRGFMLEDSGISILLTQKKFRETLQTENPELIFLDGAWEEELSDTDVNVERQPSPSDAAYTIYTSGSTGTPKGVVISNHSLANYIHWAQQQYAAEEAVSMPLFSTIAADLTLTSIFLPLVSGGTIVVYPESETEVDMSIVRVVEDNQVDVLKLTPSHLALVERQIGEADRLKTLILGGEELRCDLAAKVSAAFNGKIKIYNEYGPTEATVGCMIHRFDPENDISGSVPIGKPIANTRIYILDTQLNPLARGVIGELYIAGAGLARGYHNQPELTGARFPDDPFYPGKKMYRSGDLARFKSDDCLEFLGRIDDQVKIRGFRIELGEIESALLSHPQISASVAKVIQYQRKFDQTNLRYCKKCGLASNHPNANLNDNEICEICHHYQEYQSFADAYFKKSPELMEIFRQAKAHKSGVHDCLMLLSGGKDSTFVLYQLVELGLHPLVFSMDNGYISDEAKANIQRVVDDLGLELVWGQTPAMNEIFVDSLKRFSNVCNGCFKVIYTLSIQLAKERGIKYIVTGLSRGQFFETRVSELFKNKIFEGNKIDESIIEARKAYHRMDDAVSRCMDVSIFQDDAVFEEIQFVDYYRYSDVRLEEMLEFLDKKAPWVRPSDTGRSTNCLINEAGIYTHKKERGFHNYALPYSWDVRLGHKERNAALEELDDHIDEENVRRILDEIGYVEKPQESEKRLAAYYVSDEDIPAGSLRDYLTARLPAYMIPSHFIRLDKIPLNATGKVNRRALPLPSRTRANLQTGYAAPTSELETLLTGIWGTVLGIEKVGIHDNFFDLGGDSIHNIQIVSRAGQAGIKITPSQLFQHPTISELALVAVSMPGQQADQGPVYGEAPLTPIQRWFFELGLSKVNHWNMTIQLSAKEQIDTGIFQQALDAVIGHHDTLGMRFRLEESQWVQIFGQPKLRYHFHELKTSTPDQEKHTQAIAALQQQLDIAKGPLVGVLLYRNSQDGDLITITVHHLAIDGVSWSILIEDLNTAYQALQSAHTVALPPKTTSMKQWTADILTLGGSEKLLAETAYWQKQLNPKDGLVPPDDKASDGENEPLSETVTVTLSAARTATLLREVPQVYHTHIDEILLTALAQSMAHWRGSTSLQIHREGHGRELLAGSLDVTRTIGWFTAISPLVIRLKGDESPGDAIQAVKEQVRKVPNKGAGFPAIIAAGADRKQADELKAAAASDILFNYLGQLDSLSEPGKMFQLHGAITASHDPATPESHLLEINAFVINGTLEVHWKYSYSHFHSKTIAALSNNYILMLERLIEHCLAPEAGGFTPSDFPMAKLNNQKMDKLAKLLASADKKKP